MVATTAFSWPLMAEHPAGDVKAFRFPGVRVKPERASFLEHLRETDVLCDATRPLGTFLAEFEHDPDGEWSRLGLMPLREALQIIIPNTECRIHPHRIAGEIFF